MDKQPAVYIIASGGNGTLYAGVTSDLVTHTWQHRKHVVGGFTRTCQVHRLAWHELHGDMFPTIVREKRIKKWNRVWKIELIEKMNPCWNDL